MSYSELLIESIFQNIPSFLFWKDKNSVYLGCNQRYAELLGLEKPSDIIGKTDYDLNWSPEYGDDPQLFQQGDQATLAGEHVTNQEEWLATRNGEKILALVNKAPLYDVDRKVIGVLGIATDITATKQLQQHLAKMQYQLKGMMIISASISHELRTPLAALKNLALGIAQALPELVEAYEIAQRNALTIPPLSTQKIQLIKTGAEHLNKTVDQCNMILTSLLTNLTVQNEGRSLKLETCSAVQCIDEALAKYPFPHTFPHARVHWNPKTHQDFKFNGQCLAIIHVIFNLLKNALYFIHKKGSGHLEIWLDTAIDYNTIHFRDTGTGIKPEYLPQIFECFFTQDTNKGSGIGLAFCEITMQQLGGNIECYSEYGKFTEFILHFPKLRMLD
ncbi:MAG: PAS domain-containing sensor histidine kinase [Gammaproteobacteria bacterium]